MSPKLPLAFLSYAHSDDEHESGRLRLLAERLGGEVRLQSGREFPIFIDRSDLKWGQQWRTRIEDSHDGATFLIPILTPSYFKSEYCRKELLYFLAREAELRRGDLVMPIYYVRCRELDEEEARAGDDLALLLHERQHKDWRRFRHEAWNGAEMGRQLERMAAEIVEALERASAPQRVTATMPTVAETEWARPMQLAVATPPRIAAPPSGQLTPEGPVMGLLPIDPVVRHLATFIGPIAKIVVNRLAKQHGDLDTLYIEAAKQIETDIERKRFLQTRPR